MATLLFVTGASRGLGRAIAVEFCKTPLLLASEPLEAILLARHVQGLNETKHAMETERSKKLKVYSYSVDLGNLETLEAQIKPIMDRHTPRENHLSFDKSTKTQSRAILINCAGTTGPIGRNPSSLQEIQRATDLNFTSKSWLTSSFLTRFERDFDETMIVNISSMCAVKPTPTMGLYCAMGAARDMYHTVLAMDSSKTTRILNYAPGSCDTRMQHHLRNHESLDTSVQAYCKNLVSDGGIVDCKDTAAALVQRILEPNGFENGERIEFVNVETYKY